MDYYSIALDIKSVLKSQIFCNKEPLSEQLSLTCLIISYKQAE